MILFVGTLVVSHGELLMVPLLTVNVFLLALLVLDDRLPALGHRPAEGLGLVHLSLLPLVFCSPVLKPDFHLKLFIVITFYIKLINKGSLQKKSKKKM